MNLVEIELEIQNETSEIRSAVNEAAGLCKEFNTKDEMEIINIIGNEHDSKISSATSQQSILCIGHQSPIPIATEVINNNDMQELARNKHKLKKKQKISRGPCASINEDSDSNTKEIDDVKVDVRKKLQHYEDLHQHFAKLMEQEQLLLKKHQTAKLKGFENINKEINKDNNITEMQNSEHTGTEEYVQIPIRELITNFEQQCRQENLNNNTHSCARKEINLSPVLLNEGKNTSVCIHCTPKLLEFLTEIIICFPEILSKIFVSNLSWIHPCKFFSGCF